MSKLKNLLEDVSVIYLTPDKAREFLANQRNNRRVKEANVSKLINDMTNNRFVYNGDPLRFDRHGRLGDGQHRCLACIKTGLTFPVLVVRNLPDEAFLTIDIGASRTAADLFTFQGIPNATTVSSSVRFYLSLCNNNSGIGEYTSGHLGVQAKNPTNSFTNVQLLDVYKENVELWNRIVLKVKRCDRRFLTASNNGGIAFYLINEKKHPEEKVMTFITQLNGKRDSDYNVINLMRDILIDKMERRNNTRYTASYIMGLLAKTWNSYVTGRELKALQYNKDREGFISFI